MSRAHTAVPPLRISRYIIGLAVLGLVAAAIPAWIFRDSLGLGSSAEPRKVSDVIPGAAAPGGHAHADKPGSGDAADSGEARSSGPISELDKQLLIKVRQADLWEMPAGRLAQEHASSEAVKRAGLHLLEGHSRLDQMVRETSEALDIPIPDKPSAEQQEWVQKLKDTRGAEFDTFFANQLRNSHGKVFVVIAQVRATTQNSVIRDLAIEANRTVNDHMEVLEDTGLVQKGTFDDVAATVNN